MKVFFICIFGNNNC